MVMSDQGGASNSLAAPVAVMRDYRKGNWTMTETMVLIEAKKMDDERRMRIRTAGAGLAAGEPSSSAGGVITSKPSEPRWKWVEDYCWRKGCYRSQNQCNDKWDNLMRDYKKVRDYERRRRSTATDSTNTEDLSYWKMDKAERKDRNLPTNLLQQIYEALVEVVERKVGGAGSGGPAMVVTVHGSGSAAASSHLQAPAPPPGVSQGCMSLQPAASSLLPPLPLPPQYILAPMLPALPPQQPSPVAEASPRPQPFPGPMERSQTSDSETNEQSHHSSPAKRRRTRIAGDEDEGKRAAPGASSGNSYEAVGTAISRSASIIAEALQACDEREERRHKDLLSIQERRLKLKETNTETNRHGINGLVEAINKLADSIHALAAASSSKDQSSSANK